MKQRRDRSAKTPVAKGVSANYPAPMQDPSANEPGQKVRFEATIHPGRKAAIGDLVRLDIDTVPDPKGQIRALVTADDCVRLLIAGFEVRLLFAHPIRPLDPKLISTDESVRRELEEKLRGLDHPPLPKELT